MAIPENKIYVTTRDGDMYRILAEHSEKRSGQTGLTSASIQLVNTIPCYMAIDIVINRSSRTGYPVQSEHLTAGLIFIPTRQVTRFYFVPYNNS